MEDRKRFSATLDALVLLQVHLDEMNNTNFAKINLNYGSRAFLLLVGDCLRGEELKRMLRLSRGPVNSEGYSVHSGIRQIFRQTSLGKISRWGNNIIKMQFQTFFVGIPVSKPNLIKLLHLNTLNVNWMILNTL